MPIVTENEVARTLRLDKFGKAGIGFALQLMRLLKMTDLNNIYDRYYHLEGIDFINAVLGDLNITIETSQSDLNHIPKSGPFIIVSNHPLGAIDGLILLKLLLTHSKDAKIMANFILTKIKPLENYICPVNPFEDRKEVFNSTSGLRLAIQQIKNGNPIGIFPAGEVSDKKNALSGLTIDKTWELSVMKLIKNARVPVIPIYFHACNSDAFYFLSRINANFRTASLPSEVFRSQDKKITLRIGRPIPLELQEKYKDISLYTQFVRQKTYLLGRPFKRERLVNLKDISKRTRETKILSSAGNTVLEKEIDVLKNTNALLSESGNYQVYFTKINDFPALHLELGRLREITFRAVGEGTNKNLDIDKFDDYYHHLLLWDTKASEIAGAYRLGMGKEIYSKKGMKGFYLSELFYLTGPMSDFFSQSIELGRAFISVSYQQRPLPLFLLWKGIIAVTNLHPEYKYLIGAASISNQYSEFSKSLLVQYLRLNHFDENLSHYVSPKKNFKSVLTHKDKWLLENLESVQIKELDKMIEEIEPQGLKIPVLIKKYLLQNALLIGFNVDPAFNNAIDGLMYIETSRIEMNKNK